MVVRTSSLGTGKAARSLVGPKESSLEKMTLPFSETSKEPLRLAWATATEALGYATSSTFEIRLKHVL